MSSKKVRKAIIAAAGFGTRFLPQTKAMPKEMLPIVDKPIIQYIVEELVEAGIQDIVIVSGYHKRAIEDHFDDVSADLAHNLRQGGKQALLASIKRISELANFVYVRQKGPYGNATPVMSAQHLIGDEPFLYVFADDLFVATPSRFQQMIALYHELDGAIFPCIRVSKDEDYERYGIMAGQPMRKGVLRLSQIIEKPGRAAAPSNLASVGGFLLTPDIFRYLDHGLRALKGHQEFQIQPAMQRMIDDNKALYAFEVANGRYYDTGNKLDYLKTVVDFALTSKDVKEEFRTYLKRLITHL